jgi:hypothetical protein
MTRKHYTELAENLAHQLNQRERSHGDPTEHTGPHLDPVWNAIWDTINLSIIPVLRKENDRFSEATFCSHIHKTLGGLREQREALAASREARA